MKELNIFELDKVKKDAEKIKLEISDRLYQTKKIVLKGVNLAVVVVGILLSSTAYGAEHFDVDTWDAYESAIISDILKQDKEIIIHYTGPETFDSVKELDDMVKNLFSYVFFSYSGDRANINFKLER